MIRNLVALRCDFCNETQGAIFDTKDEQQMLDIATQSGWKVRPAAPGVTYAICVRCVEKGRDFPTPASASYVAPESDLLQAEVERLGMELAAYDYYDGPPPRAIDSTPDISDYQEQPCP